MHSTRLPKKVPMMGRQVERIADLPTVKTPAVEQQHHPSLASATLEVPALRATRPRVRVVPPLYRRQATATDRVGVLVGILATLLAVGASWYSFAQHWTLIYGDALSHLLIARRIYDSATPGLAQLGAVWLPLPHLLLAPFAANDWLWQTGLSGAIVGGGCYVGTAVYLYRAAVRLTGGVRWAACVGVLVFLCNPNVLYLQSTPMSEPVCWLTFTAACSYLLAFVQEEGRSQETLVKLSLATCAATLARYDGWILLAVVPPVLIVTGISARSGWRRIEGQLALFGILGGLGVALWLLWSRLLFGSWLYFQNGPYSSAQQTRVYGFTGASGMSGHLGIDLWLYAVTVIETLGSGLFALVVLSVLALPWTTLRRRQREGRGAGLPVALAAASFLSPAAFGILAVYTGQVALLNTRAHLFLSGVIPHSEVIYLFNARFGSELVAPAALFVATLAARLALPRRRWKRGAGAARVGRHIAGAGVWVARAALVAGILFQSGWIAHGGIVSVLYNANPPFCVGDWTVNAYLSQHYDGGPILETLFPFHLSGSDAGIDFSHVIYEGSGALWTSALAHPERSVNWIVIEGNDSVGVGLEKADPTFAQHFTLVAVNPYSGLTLYRRNGLPPEPQRALAPYLADEQAFCSIHSYQPPYAGGS